MPNYKCECPMVFGGDDAQRDRDIHMDSCEFVKIRKERDAALLQIDAMQKAMEFDRGHSKSCTCVKEKFAEKRKCDCDGPVGYHAPGCHSQ